MKYSKAQMIKAQTEIIKIMGKIIEANAAAARIYKTKLKESDGLDFM